MRQATCLLIAAIVFSTGWQIVSAEEPDGVVDKVQGNEISFKPEFHFLPSIGDKIKILVKIPDVGEAEVGTAAIIRIDDERVYARVEKATGKVSPGQIVRSLAAATPAPPAPTSGQRVLIVKSPTAKVMSGANVAAQVRSGQRLPFTKRERDWYLVEFQRDGRSIRGWIHRNDVRVETAPSVPAPRPVRIDGWGTLVDPAGGATAVKKDNVVELRVPGGYRDLWPTGRVNAPRILQTVKGDFAVQVKVTSPIDVAGLSPPRKRPKKASKAYRAACLIIWHDENNFARLERASSETTSRFWFYKAYDHGEIRLAEHGVVLHSPACWLRIERKKGTFYTWYRQKGDAEWTAGKVHRLALPDEVQVGVSLINVTNQPFTVRFEDLVIE